MSATLFSSLSAAELQLITALGRERRYKPKQVILFEGEAGDAMYFILEGEVVVYVTNADGKETILDILVAGAHFGELALFDGIERSASVAARVPARLLRVTRGDYQRGLREHPELAIKLLVTLSQRVRVLTDLVKDLASNDVYGRVARLLKRLARTVDGIAVIEPAPTQREIAARIGASREMVGRIFKELQTGGYIELGASSIRLLGRLPAAW